MVTDIATDSFMWLKILNEQIWKIVRLDFTNFHSSTIFKKKKRKNYTIYIFLFGLSFRLIIIKNKLEIKRNNKNIIMKAWYLSPKLWT